MEKVRRSDKRIGTLSMVTRWNIKEHYVAGEFAGYVVVTDDKYEDVVCCGIGADQRDDAVLIASAPALKAECDRLREALERVVKLLDRPMLKDDMCLYMNKAIRVAREALKGARDE